MDKGLRFNEGKTRHDLVPVFAQEQYAKVLTKGSEKYTTKFENEWERLFIVSNAVSLKLNTVKESVVIVTKDNFGMITLNTGKDKNLTLGNGGRLTEIEKENWMKLEELIQNCEREIKKQNGKDISESLILQSHPTQNYVKKAVKFVAPKNILTLTIVTIQENSEESFVVSATTVLDSLEIMKRVLKEQYNISVNQVKLKHQGERNWELGMKWSKVTASLKRHTADFERGEDFDKETGLLHTAHIMTNAAFLTEYYKIYPQGDDRPHKYLSQAKIGLDIDEVLADWVGHWTRHHKQDIPEHWNFDRDIASKFEFLKDDKEFWLSIPVKTLPSDIGFEPHCYITSRSIPAKWTEEWLDKNGFPSVPVYSIGHGVSKIEAVRNSGCDIYVDDRFENFVELNNAGICCFLFDAPHNRKYDVGYKRIKSLSELL